MIPHRPCRPVKSLPDRVCGRRHQVMAREIVVTPEKAYMILRKISPEHARLMGFGEGQHPSWMIWTVLPIVPPSERPSIQMSAQRRGEDDLTCSLFAAIKANQDLERFLWPTAGSFSLTSCPNLAATAWRC